MRWTYQRLKTNREENLTKHVGFLYAYVKKAKNRKINNAKSGDEQKKQDSYSTIKNKTHFSLWVFDCDFQDASLILIPLNVRETWSSFILKFCKQIWGVERAALLWSAPGGT